MLYSYFGWLILNLKPLVPTYKRTESLDLALMFLHQVLNRNDLLIRYINIWEAAVTFLYVSGNNVILKARSFLHRRDWWRLFPWQSEWKEGDIHQPWDLSAWKEWEELPVKEMDKLGTGKVPRGRRWWPANTHPWRNAWNHHHLWNLVRNGVSIQ